MRFRGVVVSLLAALLAACGSNGGQLANDAGIVPENDSGVADAGVPDCSSPTVPADAPCGELSWMDGGYPSRLRNHHFTFIARSDAGTFLYVAGGANGNAVMANVDRAAIAADGTLGPWQADTALAEANGGMTGGVVGNVVVMAGGMTMNGVSDLAYTSLVQPDGTLGAWTGAGSTGHKRMHPGGFVKGNQLYVMGGFDDPNVWDDIVKATVNPDGSLSAFTPAGTLPGPRSHFSVTEVDGYVYLTGGLAQSAFQNPPALKTVSRGRILQDGTIGEWTQLSDLLYATTTHAGFAYGGWLYLAGGLSDQSGSLYPRHEKRVYRAPLLPDHSIGPFREAAALPVARAHVHQLPMFGNHVYSVAGAIDFNLNSTDSVAIGTIQ